MKFYRLCFYYRLIDENKSSQNLTKTNFIAFLQRTKPPYSPNLLFNEKNIFLTFTYINCSKFRK